MRDTREVALGGGIAILYTFLTWGQVQKIEAALMKGANFKTDGNTPDVSFSTDFMLEAKYIALEQAIKGIVIDGVEKPFTREWMDNLSVDDGNTLYAAVEEMTAKKK